jgi:hypothetical protein
VLGLWKLAFVWVEEEESDREGRGRGGREREKILENFHFIRSIGASK